MALYTVGSELTRMALELQMFPFIPRTITRVGKRFKTTGGIYGAPVYHDILRHGGSGSRRAVLRIVEALIGPSELWKEQLATLRPLARSAVIVAQYRLADDDRVHPPLLARDAITHYVATPKPDPSLQANAAHYGQHAVLLVQKLTRPGPRPSAAVWASDILTLVSAARMAGHFALLHLQDDTPQWLAERDFVRSLSVIPRPTPLARPTTGPTRLITLHDDES